MGKKKLRVILISIASAVLILIGAICLVFGRSYDIKFTTPQCGETLVSIARGKVVALSFGMRGSINEINFSNDDVIYIGENITGKGYSTKEATEKITQYAESRGGNVSEVKKSGYVFVGIDWIKK